MDHYSPRHGIIDALTKLRYEIPYLDLERWQWCVCVFIEIKSIVMEQELDLNILMLLWALVLV